MDKWEFPNQGDKSQGYKKNNSSTDWKTGCIVNVVGGKNANLKGFRLKTVRAKGNFDIRLGTFKVLSVSRNPVKAI